MGYYQKKKSGKKSHDIGYLTLDLNLRDVGRIKKSSGTRDETTFASYKKSIKDLYQQGYLEPLLALKNNQVSVRELHSWWRNKGSVPPWENKAVSVSNAINEWFESAELEKTTINGYKACFQQLLKGSRTPTLADLPSILAKYREKCRKAATIKSFNQTRAACMSLLRDTLGKSHHLYLKVRDVKVLPFKVERRKEVHPFYPSDLYNAFKSPDVDERLRDTVWAMCLTGTSPKEFLTDGMKVVKDRHLIEVYGKKRATRVREVPLVYPDLNYAPWCKYRHLRKLFNQVFKGRTLYDCRRTFKVWCRKAGIDEVHQLYYMGHKFSVSQKYGEEEISRWVLEDRNKLWEYIKSDSRGQSSVETNVTEALEIPPTPFEETNLADTTLRDFWIPQLNKVLEGWHKEGKMRRLYRVEKLKEVM